MTFAATSAAPRRPAHRGPILAALMATMALSAMDNTVVATAIPQVVRDLGGFSLFSWVFSAYLLLQTVTIPVYGKLADQWGRKPILIGGTIVFLIFSGLCALSWNMVSLIAFRGLQGIGAGAIMATVNTLAGDLYDLSERGRVQGWLSSVWGVSAVLGPVLGGSLAQYASWRWIFVINLPVGAVSLTLIGRFLHERVTAARHRVDVLGGLLILVAAGSLVFGLLQGGVAWGWLSPPGVAVFAVTALAASLAVVVERRAPEPIMPPWFWGRRVLAGSGLGAAGLGVLVIGPSTFLPTYGQEVLGLGAIAAGGVLATMSIGWPLAASQSGKLFLRIGFRDTAVIGAVICLAGVLVFVLAPRPEGVGIAVASTFVLGFGLGLLSVGTMVGPQSTVAWEQRGVVTGSIMFCRYLGQSLGAAIFGAVFNAALRHRLRSAPPPLRGRLPHQVNGVSTALSRPGGAAAAAVHGYLRQAIAAGAHDVYLGLAGVAVVTLGVVIVIIPRRFATSAGAAADQPGEQRAGNEPPAL
jgi:EmrB/QacA subfamily drug resistance transporter